ncbi:MAG TPA: type II secretion system F family protein [archaeon]|nr:type II secretion system F family protein [archaeon]
MPLRDNRRSLAVPGKIESREYKIFKEEEKLKTLPVSLYEKACRFSLKIAVVQMGGKDRQKMQDAIDFSHLKATPEGVASLTVLLGIAVSLPLLMLAVADFLGYPGLPPGQVAMALLVFLPFIVYLYNYPFHLRKMYEIETGSEIVNMILYMAIYMRNNPNLEGAMEFSAENLSGKLVYELRKLMWDVEVGNYVSMQEGLLAYSTKWKSNREFLEAIDLLIGSLSQTEERRLRMLDQAVQVILAGNRESAQHFTQDLNTPVMFLHAMGIILPLLGFVMFPLVSVFLNVGPSALFVLYDIILPVILFFAIKSVLEKRPATFSKIDITESPEVPKPGKFFTSKDHEMRALPFAAVTFLAMAGVGALFFAAEGTDSVVAALLLTGAVAAGMAVYFYLTTFQGMEVRGKTLQVEQEFGDTLFRMGNNLSSGIPVEKALEQSVRATKNLKIRGFFVRALDNIRNLGMTFRQAFFDQRYGAIRFYPSKLIKSVMTTVVESSTKGSRNAAAAMLSVATYLKNLHDTQEEIRAQLNDPLSSMKFQIYFMSPMITGIVITLTLMILKILGSIGQQAQSLPGVPFLDSFYQTSTTPFEFIFVVGIYLLETCLVLAMFINGIENGQDKEGFRKLAADSIFVGFIFFWIVIAVTIVIFMPVIEYAF